MAGILILANCSVGLSQNPSGLQALIKASKEYLPVLKQKQVQINAAAYGIKEVQHSFLPQLKFSEQLNMGTDNSLAGSYFTMGITPSTSGGIRAGNSLEAATGNLAVVSGEYELVNFGLNQAKLATAQSLVELQKSDLQKEQYLLSLQVAKSYFTALRVLYKLEADKQNVNRYDSIFHIIQAFSVSGFKAGADTSQAKAELSRARIVYNQTLGNLNQLKEQLSFFTGITPEKLQIDTINGSILTRNPLLAAPVGDSIENPLIDYYQQRKNILLLNENLIKKSFLPKVLLVGSVGLRGSSIQYNDQFKPLLTGLGYQRYNYGVGLAFTYNLFNGLYKKDRLFTNRLGVEASEYELAQQRALLDLSAKQANNALLTTRNNLTELPVQLQSAQDTYLQKLAQYHAGIISVIDLTNASFVLYRSQTDYIETLSDWYLAQLDKAAATGNLYSFIQNIK